MSNVIHVEFGKKNAISQQGASLSETDPSLTAYFNSVNEDSCLFEYLDMLRQQGMDDEDILDVADAINSYEVYMAADEVVRQLADSWLQTIV